MIDPAESARLALFCAEAEAVGPVPMPPTSALDGYSAGPPLPPWVAKDYSLLGCLSGQDAFLEGWLNLGAHRVFYGWVMEGPEGIITAIRGTESAAEWAIDATAIPERTAHPTDGFVETGFWNLHQTMLFRGLGGVDVEFAAGLLALGDRHTVTGHSLGGPLAEYTTLALAESGASVRSGRYFASPHPGDSTFAAYFASKVTDYACYAYERDLVPRVPAGLGYSPIGNTVTLPANPLIPDNPASWHHAGNYAWLIWPQSLELLPEAERTYPR